MIHTNAAICVNAKAGVLIFCSLHVLVLKYTVVGKSLLYFVIFHKSWTIFKTGQFLNLLVLMISKHPLHAKFDQVLAGIFETLKTVFLNFYDN